MQWLRTVFGVSTVNRLVPVVVAVVLVGAALFKIHGALTGPSDFRRDPRGVLFQLLLIEVELLVGLALFFAIRPSLMRVAALGLFAVFLVAALLQAFAGARSCACLGRTEVAPWIMASLDACILVVLWYWKPVCPSASTRPFRWALFLGCCAFPALLPFLILGERGPERAYPGLVIARSEEDLGDVLQGATRAFELILRNPHAQEITVNAVESSCPCLHAQGLPWRFSAGEERSVKLKLELQNEPGFSGRLLLEVRGKAAKTEAFHAQVKVRVVPGFGEPEH
jgi:hypothetical protein